MLLLNKIFHNNIADMAVGKNIPRPGKKQIGFLQIQLQGNGQGQGGGFLGAVLGINADLGK